MSNDRKCGTCEFSRTFQVVDPVYLASFPNNPLGLGKRSETLCYIQGKPQTVDPERDWCYAYKPKNEEIS